MDAESSANSSKEREDPFKKYTVQTQIRIHQRGPKKGQEYKLFKFTDKKSGRLVNHASVLKAAKIKLGRPYRTDGFLPGQSQRTRITTTLKITNYVRQKDSEYGRADTEADAFLHYRTEVSTRIKSQFDAFNYKKAAGGETIDRDYLYDFEGRRRYGSADVELVQTNFY